MNKIEFLQTRYGKVLGKRYHSDLESVKDSTQI